MDWALLMREVLSALGRQGQRWHVPLRFLKGTVNHFWLPTASFLFFFFMRKGLWPVGTVVAEFQDRFPGLYSGKMGSHWVTIRTSLLLASQRVFTPHIPLPKYSPYWRTDAAELHLTPSSLAFPKARLNSPKTRPVSSMSFCLLRAVLRKLC